jgi:hypothetical protein
VESAQLLEPGSEGRDDLFEALMEMLLVRQESPKVIRQREEVVEEGRELGRERWDGTALQEWKEGIDRVERRMLGREGAPLVKRVKLRVDDLGKILNPRGNGNI